LLGSFACTRRTSARPRLATSSGPDPFPAPGSLAVSLKCAAFAKGRKNKKKGRRRSSGVVSATRTWANDDLARGPTLHGVSSTSCRTRAKPDESASAYSRCGPETVRCPHGSRLSPPGTGRNVARPSDPRPPLVQQKPRSKTMRKRDRGRSATLPPDCGAKRASPAPCPASTSFGPRARQPGSSVEVQAAAALKAARGGARGQS